MPTFAAYQLRAKMLGVVLQDARAHAGKTRSQCASLMGITPTTLAAYEVGRRAISLPELEVMAFVLNLPLRNLLGSQPVTPADQPAPSGFGPLIKLRQRMVGTRILQLRKGKEMRRSDLAKATGIPAGRIAAFEAGRRPIPVPELESLSEALGTTLGSFLESSGPVGERVSTLEAFEQFSQLSADVRAFVCQPINESYLRLAMRMSELSADRLRSIAEGLLEITF